MEKVKVFLTTEVSQNKTSAQMFLNRQSAIDELTLDHQTLVTQCGGVDEFFDAVNSGQFANIERMEINEVEYDLMDFIKSAVTPQHNPEMKPYMFYVLETIDGHETHHSEVRYSAEPRATVKEIIFEQCRDVDLDEPELLAEVESYWDEDKLSLTITTNLSSAGWLEVTPAEELIWQLAHNVHMTGVRNDKPNPINRVSYEFGDLIDSDNLRVTVTVNDTLIGEDQQFIISGNSLHLDSEFSELLEKAGIEPFNVVLAVENRESSF